MCIINLPSFMEDQINMNCFFPHLYVVGYKVSGNRVAGGHLGASEAYRGKNWVHMRGYRKQERQCYRVLRGWELIGWE